MSPSRLFRTAAVAEAITWALLIAGMLQKYVFEAGDWGVSIGGGLHGLVFIAYCVIAVIVAVNQRWSLGRSSLSVAAAVIPFATIPLEIAFARSGALRGAWRTEASDDPRDSRLIDRVVRWWVARPLLFGAIATVAVVAVFATLLVVGPPGGRDA